MSSGAGREIDLPRFIRDRHRDFAAAKRKLLRRAVFRPRVRGEIFVDREHRPGDPGFGEKPGFDFARARGGDARGVALVRKGCGGNEREEREARKDEQQHKAAFVVARVALRGAHDAPSGK